MNAHCQSRLHCRTCRTDDQWRLAYSFPAACPHGITAATLPTPKPLTPPPSQLDAALLAQNEITKKTLQNNNFLPQLSFLEKLENLKDALKQWSAAGFSIAQDEIIENRRSLCSNCEFWKPNARLGYGKCEKCGCGVLKWWLQNSQCIIGKW